MEDVTFNETPPPVRRNVGPSGSRMGSFLVARGFARDEAQANTLLLKTALILIVFALVFTFFSFSGNKAPTSDEERARLEASTPPPSKP